MNTFFILVASLVLISCNQKPGTIEHEPAVSVSEMLLTDQAANQSSVHKEFLKKFEVDRVSFGFDQFDVSSENQAYLRKVADHLLVNLDLRIEIEGNCDIRGSKDYNIALGEKRANSVKKFLVSQGVAEHRISTVSFGSRVLMVGDTQEIYAKNRVAIIIVK